MNKTWCYDMLSRLSVVITAFLPESVPEVESVLGMIYQLSRLLVVITVSFLLRVFLYKYDSGNIKY